MDEYNEIPFLLNLIGIAIELQSDIHLDFRNKAKIHSFVWSLSFYDEFWVRTYH